MGVRGINARGCRFLSPLVLNTLIRVQNWFKLRDYPGARRFFMIDKRKVRDTGVTRNNATSNLRHRRLNSAQVAALEATRWVTCSDSLRSARHASRHH